MLSWTDTLALVLVGAALVYLLRYFSAQKDSCGTKSSSCQRCGPHPNISDRIEKSTLARSARSTQATETLRSKKFPFDRIPR